MIDQAGAARRIRTWNLLHPGDAAQTEWAEELVIAYAAATQTWRGRDAVLAACERVREMAAKLPHELVCGLLWGSGVRGRGYDDTCEG